MIKTTHKKTPDFTVSAYSDNAAVLSGEEANMWAPDYSTGLWKLTPEVVHILAKVEVSALAFNVQSLLYARNTTANPPDRHTTTPLLSRR